MTRQDEELEVVPVDPHDPDEPPPLTILDDHHDRLVQDYQASVRALASLPELEMRRARLAHILLHLDPPQRVWWLDQLIRGSLWGRTPELDAMLACASWLTRLDRDRDYALLQELFHAAYDADRKALLPLLRDLPAHRSLNKGARLPDVRLPLPREVSLGERRWLASGNDRAILDRLLRDHNPLVIEKLAANPHLGPQEMLTILTRRPTRPDLILTVLRRDRYFVQHRIREAAAFNPYLTTSTVLKLMPTLRVDVIRNLKYANDLHPAVPEFAALLVELREEHTAPWGV